MRRLMILAGAAMTLTIPLLAQTGTSGVGSALGVGMQASPAVETRDTVGHELMAVSATTIMAPVTAVTPVAASTKAFAEANARMHSGMGIAYSGDADVDFVKGMIPHHQGAIDMAKVVIAHGKDPDLRMLANEIIKAQTTEIEMMNKWLTLHGPKDPNAAPIVKATKPRPPAMRATKVEAKPMGDLLDEVTKTPAVVSATTSVVATVSASAAVAVSNSAAAPAMTETVTAGPATEPKLIEDDEMPMPLLEDMLIPTGVEPAPANAQ